MKYRRKKIFKEKSLSTKEIAQKSNLLNLKFFQIDLMSENLSSDKENFKFNLISNFRFRKIDHIPIYYIPFSIIAIILYTKKNSK